MGLGNQKTSTYEMNGLLYKIHGIFLEMYSICSVYMCIYIYIILVDPMGKSLSKISQVLSDLMNRRAVGYGVPLSHVGYC